MGSRLGRRLIGAAVGIVLAAVLALATIAAVPDTRLVVRDPDGATLLDVPVRPGDSVVLRYRNSIYDALAEERFVVRGGALELIQLAADERAVLDEYYEAHGVGATREGDVRRWRARPAMPLTLVELAIAATDLGERTLLVRNEPPLELWRHATDDRPTVTITLEPVR